MGRKSEQVHKENDDKGGHKQKQDNDNAKEQRQLRRLYGKGVGESKVQVKGRVEGMVTSAHHVILAAALVELRGRAVVATASRVADTRRGRR